MSINNEPYLRYYNQNDILRALQALCSSAPHASLYSGICKSIMCYWGIPESSLSIPELNRHDIFPMTKKSILPDLIERVSHKVDVVEGDKIMLSVCEHNIDSMEGSSCVTASSNLITIDLPGHQINNNSVPVGCIRSNMISERVVEDFAASNSSVSQLTSPSDHIQQGLMNKCSILDLCNSGSNASCDGHGKDICFPAQSKGGHLLGQGMRGINSVDHGMYNGSIFKPNAYTNYYMHGEFAASASAKLTVLSSEETRVSEVHTSDNARKVASAFILTQAKAFSLTAPRFFWPTSERKLMEVPRERCDWCLSCKAAVTSKRGCMLNQATLSATKSALKVISGLLPLKNGEGNFPSIAAYILYMEESLLGLVVGPFLDASYRKQWRQHVEQASTSSLKFLLLELEKNIRIITFSGDWFKLLDDWVLDTSVIQNATCTVATVTRRGPNGRKNKKQSGMSEASDEPHDFNSLWWRGGKLSKFILQKAVLPRSMIKRVARQGGSRKISCIFYADNSEIPRRNRQLVWRASVSMSNNASQLGLQVRYLDFHLRWSELVRTELTPQEGKGSETEASAFRNATICDKKVVENKIVYGVAFGGQKHLPSRVMKNVIEIDQSQVGMDKYWFSETRVPLYLIKEFEQNSNNIPIPSAVETVNTSTKSRRRWLKSFRKNIFYYLSCRRDNTGLCSCSSCQMDIMIGYALQCSKCKGFCHEHCSVTSMNSAIKDVGFIITCRQCNNPKTCTQNDNDTKFPISPLILQRQACHSLVSASKGVRPGSIDLSASVRAQHSHPVNKHSTSDSSLAAKSRQKIRSWGVIWKKKNWEDSGSDFRLNYLLLKGGSGLHHLKPVCLLCNKPYRSDLMYICCETCKNWYHADALELEESKILDVVGFKCCKCRRIKSPECPYMDPKDKRLESRKFWVRAKQENSPVDNNGSRAISGSNTESQNLGFTVEETSRQDDNPLLFSLAKVELITDHDSEVDVDLSSVSGPMPRKLPIRRSVKHEGGIDDIYEICLPNSISSTNLKSYNLLGPTEVPDSPQPGCNTSINVLEGETDFIYQDFNCGNFNYEDMDFEPQTYFSFTELLPDDNGLELGANASHDAVDIGPKDVLDQALSSYVKNCEICSESDPVPDLSCTICGHCQCSPWDDSVPCIENWSCGQCREWG